MRQINFRIDDDGYALIKRLAEERDVSIAEFAKQLVLERVGELRLEVALALYAGGKIGLKRAWRLSGLEYFEFRRALIGRDIEPRYDAELEDKTLTNALSLDLNQFRKQ